MSFITYRTCSTVVDKQSQQFGYLGKEWIFWQYFFRNLVQLYEICRKTHLRKISHKWLRAAKFLTKISEVLTHVITFKMVPGWVELTKWGEVLVPTPSDATLIKPNAKLYEVTPKPSLSKVDSCPGSSLVWSNWDDYKAITILGELLSIFDTWMAR